MGNLPLGTLPFAAVLPVLRTAGEETRLRILALLGEGELTVSDLTEILGQSQPRISRHLKVMVEAGLLLRYREGSWVFYRLAEGTKEAEFLRRIIASLDRNDPVTGADRERFATVRKQRSAAAQAFFAKLAPQWDLMRSLHAPEHAVEAAIAEAVGEKPLAQRARSRHRDRPDPEARGAARHARRRRRREPCDALGGARQHAGGGADRMSICGKATSTRSRCRATVSISSSSIRCCIISTIRNAP